MVATFGLLDEWKKSGFYEIQKPSKRYTVIDLQNLTALCGFVELADLQRSQRQRVEQALENDLALRDARWSEAIAVGSLAFVEKIKGELGSKAMHREVEQFEGTHVLREESEVYGFKSAVFWNESFEDART